MSKTSARHQALQEFLSARGYATIEELARHFEVTPQTVRKDINALAEEGKVQRFHGGAGMVSGSENIVYDERKGICQEEKRRIGALLATHIPDGVSVCINIGTTTEEAARALLEHKNLRVVTNSINVASICARNSSFDVVVACGTVRHRDNGIVGASAERFIREFRVDYGIIGISGIEKEMNERLTQSDIPLMLSIDVGVQDTIREMLKEGMEKFKAEGATAVLLDVKTSEIVSMVSLPDYDPNINKVKKEQALFNMATKGVYEPGSVLKIFNTAMSLESGKVKVADRFDASEPLKLKHNVIKDYRGENRWLSVPEILVYSSNIGSARMALKVGGNEQRNFLEKLGFFEPLSIEVAEKGQPLVPKKWSEGTIATVAFGYGLAVSPLHVVSGYAAMINGGIYHSPTLIKGSSKTKDGHRVISFNTSKAMRDLMRLVVTDGSGRRANVPGYEVAGKTGTANKLSAQGKYVDKKVRTTFVAAFPISNPKYALIVMLDEPKPLKETWGFVTSGWNTVPTAAKIIEAIAPQLNIKANYDLDELRRNRIIEAAYSR